MRHDEPPKILQHQQIRVTLRGDATADAGPDASSRSVPPGTLARLVEAIADGDGQPINIAGIGGERIELGGDLLLYFDTEDDTDRAEEIIEREGHRVDRLEHKSAELSNEPGELARVLKKVGNGRIDTIVICPKSSGGTYVARYTTNRQA